MTNHNDLFDEGASPPEQQELSDREKTFGPHPPSGKYPATLFSAKTEIKDGKEQIVFQFEMDEVDPTKYDNMVFHRIFKHGYADRSYTRALPKLAGIVGAEYNSQEGLGHPSRPLDDLFAKLLGSHYIITTSTKQELRGTFYEVTNIEGRVKANPKATPEAKPKNLREEIVQHQATVETKAEAETVRPMDEDISKLWTSDEPKPGFNLSETHRQMDIFLARHADFNRAIYRTIYDGKDIINVEAAKLSLFDQLNKIVKTLTEPSKKSKEPKL